MTVFAASTNYAAVIRPLQVLVMVIAVLFFLRVIRVVTVQSRPANFEKRARRRPGVLALEFLEPSERSGQRVDVETGVTIGRAGDSRTRISHRATRASPTMTETSRSKTSARPTVRT